jgi:hypothetical protein
VKSILFSCVQDGRRLLTNALFWVLSATLVVIVLVVDLALPKESAAEEYRLVTYGAPAALTEGEPMASLEELNEAVRAGGAIGVSFDADGVTIVHSGYPSRRSTPWRSRSTASNPRRCIRRNCWKTRVKFRRTFAAYRFSSALKRSWSGLSSAAG